MPQVAVKGAVAQQVLPRVSSSARDTIEGKIKVRVRVEVDPAGNVTEARLESAGPSKYFARLSLEAARGWKFTPAQVGGQAVASEWTLRFGFRRTDTEVVPTQTSP
jgi:protein TonB